MKYPAALFLLMIGLNAMCQSNNTLKVKAQLRTQDKIPLSQANVSIKDTTGTVKQTVSLNRNGRFQFEIPYDQVCELWVSCVDHQSKVIEFNTLNVPGCEGTFGYDFGGFTGDLKSILRQILFTFSLMLIFLISF
tara:strand:- start:3146 stop:3550 length:405 start_codon:yes stop_codon:yes gene_type:complete